MSTQNPRMGPQDSRQHFSIQSSKHDMMSTSERPVSEERQRETKPANLAPVIPDKRYSSITRPDKPKFQFANTQQRLDLHDMGDVPAAEIMTSPRPRTNQVQGGRRFMSLREPKKQSVPDGLS